MKTSELIGKKLGHWTAKAQRWKDPKRTSFQDYKPCRKCGRVVNHYGHDTCSSCAPKREYIPNGRAR